MEPLTLATIALTHRKDEEHDMRKPKDRMARPENRSPASEATTAKQQRPPGRPTREEEEQRPPPEPTVKTAEVVYERSGIVCPCCGKGADLQGAQRRRSHSRIVIIGTCSACGHRVKRVIAPGSDTVQALDWGAP